MGHHALVLYMNADVSILLVLFTQVFLMRVHGFY